MLLAALFVLWLGTLIASAKLARSVLNPASAFATVWLVCAGFYESEMVRLFPITLSEQMLVIGGVAATLAGALVVQCSRGEETRETVRYPLPDALVLLLAAAAFGGFFYLLAALARDVSLLVYVVAPERIERLGFQRPVVGYLNLIHIILPAVLWMQGGRRRKGRWLWRGLAMLSLLTTPFAGIKTYFTQALMTWILAVLYEAKATSLRRLGLATGVLTVLVLGYFVLYDVYFKDSTVNYTEHGVVDLPPRAAALARPLIYVTAPIPTFAAFTRFQDETYFGRSTFRGISRAIQEVEPLTLPPKIGQTYTVPVSFNAYTAFRQYYEDGREAGLLAFAFLVGFVVQAAYRAMCRRVTIPLVVLTAYLTMAQVLSPFGGFLTFPRTIFFVGILFALDCLTRGFVLARTSTCVPGTAA